MEAKGKKQLCKRIFAMMMALTMVVALMPNVQAKAADVNAPVIEAAEYVAPEDGNVFYQGDFVQINATVIDYDGELDIGNSYISVYFESVDNWDYWYPFSHEEIGENQYAINFVVEPNVLAEGVIESITIYDTEGNNSTADVVGADGNPCTVVVEESVNDSLVLTDVELSAADIELNDNVLEFGVIATIEVDGLSEEEYYSFRLRYENEDEAEYYMYVYYDEETDTYTGSDYLGFYMEEGHYTLTGIWCNDERIVIGEGVASEFDFAKNHTDFDAPVINDFGVLVNGEALEAGQIITDDDVVSIYVDVEDASENPSVYVYFDNEIYYNGYGCDLVYDEESGLYTGTIDVTELSACEWYLMYIRVYDVFENEYSLYSYEDSDVLNLYFYVERDGVCQIPTYTFDVYLEGEYGGEYYCTVSNSERLTTLNTILGGNVPTVEKEGYEFLGWAYNGELLEADTVFAVSNVVELSLSPVYNMVTVEGMLVYYGEDSKRVGEDFSFEVPYGTPFADVEAMLNLDEIVHMEGVEFQGWDFMGIPDTEGNVNSDIYVTVQADYDKSFASLYLYYYDNNLEFQEYELVVAGTEGTKWSEALADVSWPELDHAEVLEFAGSWDVSMLEDCYFWEMDTQSSNAVYNKTLIQVNCVYNTDFWNQESKEIEILVDADSSYRDILANIDVDVEHEEELGFIGWANPFNEEFLDFVPWGISGLELNAEYANMLIFVDLEYVDTEGEYQYTQLELAVPRGATYRSVMEALDSVEHFEALGFTGDWNLGIDESMLDGEIYEHETVYAVAEYEKAYATVEYNYFAKGLKEKTKVLGMVVEEGTTYAEVVAALSEQITHDEDLHFVGWTAWNEEILNSECVAGINSIYVSAEYEEKLMVVYLAYYSQDLEIEFVEDTYIVTEGATYQDMIDSITAELKHPTECGKVTWNVWSWDEEDYQQVIEMPVSYVDIMPTYEKYLIDFSYTYLNKDNVAVQVEENLFVKAGTTMGEILEGIALPDDASDAEILYWTGNEYSYMEEEVFFGFSSWDVAASYEEYVAYYVQIVTINEDNEFEVIKKFVYPTMAELENVNMSAEEEALILKHVKALNLENTSAFELLDYELLNGFDGSIPDENYDYYYATVYHFAAVYDKAIVQYEYPDEKEECVVVDAGSKLTLPEKYLDYDVNWNVTTPGGFEVVEGGETITITSPGVILNAYFVDDVDLDIDVEAPDVPDEPDVPGDSEDKDPEEGEKEDVAVKLEPEVIEQEVTKIEEAEEGETIVIEMAKDDESVATEVPVEVLEAAKGKDVEIVLDMGDYSWTINGQDIKASELEAINLEVSLDKEAIAPTVVEKLAGDKPVQQVSLTHNGNFGFKADLTINLGSEHAGKYGNLYYYDSTGKLVFMNAGLIAADGSVSLNFSHASDYVVVIDEEHTADEILGKGDTSSSMPIGFFLVGGAVVLLAIVGKKKFA